VLTAENVHDLGFLLPGEIGQHHNHDEVTDVIAEVKVGIINTDTIREVERLRQEVERPTAAQNK
jgi:hypothetical protein